VRRPRKQVSDYTKKHGTIRRKESSARLAHNINAYLNCLTLPQAVPSPLPCDLPPLTPATHPAAQKTLRRVIGTQRDVS